MILLHHDIGPGATHIDSVACQCKPTQAVTIVSAAGWRVPGEIIETAMFCTRVLYTAPDEVTCTDWFCTATGKRNGESSVWIEKEAQF